MFCFSTFLVKIPLYTLNKRFKQH